VISPASPCRFIAIASLLMPLIFIGISIALSNWFNIYRNALSDLGHATRSLAAPIFNFGLSVGGVLIVIMGTKYLFNVSKALGSASILSGYSLILVSVFDEVYGRLHFWVSVLFFITLAILLIIYIAISRELLRRLAALIALIAAIFSWIIHLGYRQPIGAAIPELISIAAITPFYIDITFRKACRIH
jgi:hypothetical membrane protein